MKYPQSIDKWEQSTFVDWIMGSVQNSVKDTQYNDRHPKKAESTKLKVVSIITKMNGKAYKKCY